jgi:asparagine synthase (glutamine-hydrolysing)
MAHSREMRQPVLDHRLVEHVFAQPSDYKIRDGESKVLLRRGLVSLLPRSIVERQDKLGYQAPMRAWFDGPLRPWVRERLAAAVVEGDGRIAADAVARFDATAGRLPDDRSRSLMSVLTWSEGRRTLREAAARTPVS